QCHDMHGQSGCPNSNTIKAGDDWLKANLPALITFANAHAGVIYITWDEPSATSKMPFIVVGPHVKTNFTSSLSYNHSSLVKAIEQSLQVPILSKVSGATAFADFFQAGFYP